MKVYEPATMEVLAIFEEVMSKFHEPLKKHDVTVDILMAHNEGAPAVSHAGYPAYAVIKIVNLKDRVKGCSDAELVIDAKKWEGFDDNVRAALIDHELTHLEPQYDDAKQLKTDDIGRPMLKIRRHDHQLGWFTEVAQRHGANSIEVMQATKLMNNDGSVYFVGEQ